MTSRWSSQKSGPRMVACSCFGRSEASEPFLSALSSLVRVRVRLRLRVRVRVRVRVGLGC